MDGELADNALVVLMYSSQVRSTEQAYSLRLQVSASQAVMMLVEVHHLEAVELGRHLCNLFLLARLFDFDTFCIPAHKISTITT